MPKDKSLISGTVKLTVYGPDGEVKKFEPTFWEKLMGRDGKPMIVENHNAVTNDGDAICADVLSGTDSQAPFKGTL